MGAGRAELRGSGPEPCQGPPGSVPPPPGLPRPEGIQRRRSAAGTGFIYSFPKLCAYVRISGGAFPLLAAGGSALCKCGFRGWFVALGGTGSPCRSRGSEAAPPSVTTQQTSRAFRVPAMASKSQKGDKNRNKSKNVESEASENPELSDKTDLAPSEDSQSLLKTESLEKVLNEISKEMNNLLSKYADTISARIALDSSYVQELDEILKEARAIENHLKQKREKLKQRFAVIANSLQS
ncbi:testis-expressed protein 12 [Taeniopygia guttata]|uniref:testis-expressed protein 12 n=1 Tax=Taeniopygia guttata TaxID=59729 RepID=UPI003BB8B42D